MTDTRILSCFQGKIKIGAKIKVLYLKKYYENTAEMNTKMKCSTQKNKGYAMSEINRLVFFIAIFLSCFIIDIVQAGFYIPQANTILPSQSIDNDTEIVSNVFSKTECILICERLFKSESFLTNDEKCLCSDKFKMVTESSMIRNEDDFKGSFIQKKKSCLDYGCKEKFGCIPIIEKTSRMTVHKCIGKIYFKNYKN